MGPEVYFSIAIDFSNSSFPRMAFWVPPSVPPFEILVEQT
jgi:hypothetical protein